jgi:7-cyano-7-deazaguanine reductase
LKSNCLVTNQPDWCSVQISYTGMNIQKEGLLRYLVSFRNDNDFHEHCIEKIFMHILYYCKPEYLTVYGRSNRRGGIDINAYRSTDSAVKVDFSERLCRQ